MNGDALSDLALALVCIAIVWHCRKRPGLTIAAGLVGLAACIGVLRFSGWSGLLGPHRFASMLAAVAAFPLLASALRWPDAPSSMRTTAAGRFALVAAAFGIAAKVASVPLWDQVVPGASALLITWTMLQRRGLLGLLGTASLIGSFVVAATGKSGDSYLGLLNSTQLMHYTLAAALALLAASTQRRV